MQQHTACCWPLLFLVPLKSEKKRYYVMAEQACKLLKIDTSLIQLDLQTFYLEKEEDF